MDIPVTWVSPPTKDGEDPPHIKTVSSSRMMIAEQCLRRAALAFIYKIEEPERPGESPLDRGSRLHTAIEDYILGKTDELDKEVKYHRDSHIQFYRDLRDKKADDVIVEERWNFTDDWQSCGDKEWDKIWFILKIDALAFLPDDEARIDDWKSGKKMGNEVKHSDQLLTYIISTFIRYPHLERIFAQMTYIDNGETLEMEMTRAEAMRFFPRLNKRLLAVTDAREFPPKPSLTHCRFCPYKTGSIVKGVEGTGACDLNPV